MASLTVEHVNKSFAQVQAIKDLSMEVQEGAIFGFLGANGAGKTTTMRRILDILRPDSGSITWNGRDVREVPRRNWGYLPEERGLYPKMRVEKGNETMSKKTVVTPERETPAQNVPEQGQTSVAVSSGGAATLHTWRNIRLIIGREYKNRVTQRSFIITSIILLVIVFLAAFIPTMVQLITAGTTSQTQIVVVNDAGSIAGLGEAKLTAYISSDLNGTTTGSRAPYAMSSQPAASLGSLQNQVKSGKLDILLVLARAPNQDLRLTYDTSASATNDSNLSTIQALAQLLTFLDTAHRLGLTPSQTQRLSAPPDLTVVYTQQSQSTPRRVRSLREISSPLPVLS